MTPPRSPRNQAASERGRLSNLARERKLELQLVLSEFAIERLLYRLGNSPHAGDYVLKGAMLFRLWSPSPGRATWDLDLLGRGASSVQDVVDVIRDLCAVPGDDAVEFDSATILGDEIRDADEYAGVRVRLEARLDRARIPMQVDVGFGDAVTPLPERVRYPTLLDHAPPAILAYPPEAVVAEKLESMVSLGVTNSRMKDFYDVYVLASSRSFRGSELARAIRATFQRRGTAVPDGRPLVLTPGFLGAPERRTQWRAFLRRGRLDAAPDATELAAALQAFLGPVLRALAAEQPPPATWSPGGPWR